MPKAVWLLVIGMMINVTGTSFLWPVNTIYMHDHLERSLTVAGIVLMLNSGAGVIGNLIGGTLFDKFGGYKTVIIGLSITTASLITLVFFHSFLPYAILLTIIGFGSGVTFPAMFAMAGTVWKEGGRKAFNAIYVAQNVGVAVGAAIGGLAASISFEWSFIGNTLLVIVFLLLVIFGYRGMGTALHAVSPESVLTQNKRIKNKSVFKALLVLCTGYLLAWICYVQWTSSIASHTQEIGIDLKQYSLLWTVNGAVIVLGQPFLNVVLKKWIHSSKAQIMIGYSIFIVSFIVVSTAHAFSGFLIAMLILTIGEMFVWPGIPSIANELAPDGRAGFYQGVVNSTATAGRMIGPVFGGFIVDQFGMNTLFGIIFGFFILSMLVTQAFDRLIPSIKVKEKPLDI